MSEIWRNALWLLCLHGDRDIHEMVKRWFVRFLSLIPLLLGIGGFLHESSIICSEDYVFSLTKATLSISYLLIAVVLFESADDLPLIIMSRTLMLLMYMTSLYFLSIVIDNSHIYSLERSVTIIVIAGVIGMVGHFIQKKMPKDSP